LDIEHSLRWHNPGRFNGYILSQHLAGTPVDGRNLRDALHAVKERASTRALGALQVPDSPVRCTAGFRLEVMPFAMGLGESRMFVVPIDGPAVEM
jgi:hypothetical protein